MLISCIIMNNEKMSLPGENCLEERKTLSNRPKELRHNAQKQEKEELVSTKCAWDNDDPIAIRGEDEPSTGILYLSNRKSLSGTVSRIHIEVFRIDAVKLEQTYI